MGKIFLDHINGSVKLYSCASCETNLTNKSELISTRFTGATGRAYLFKRVVNLTYSHVQDRVMLTGRHMVRDVMCKNCKAKLGWMYEFATEEGQKYVEFLKEPLFEIKVNHLCCFIFRYKEGRVILEHALITESEAVTDPYPRNS